MTKLKLIVFALLLISCSLPPQRTKAQTIKCRWINGIGAGVVCNSAEKQDNSTPSKCVVDKTPGICCCAKLVNTHSAKTNITENKDYTPLNFQPQIPLPGVTLEKNGTTPVGNFKDGAMNSDLLARYIKGFYDYGMMICGILAAIVLMGGGVLWLTSGGDSGKVGQAKELISGSLIGTVILFSSWIILNTINPDLLKLRPIVTKYIEIANLGCCQSSGKAEMTILSKCISPSAFIENARAVNGTKCEIEGCCAFNNVNHHNPGDKYTQCIDTVKTDCPATQTGATGLRDFLPNQICADIDKCAKVANCRSVKNGNECQNITGNYHCYGEKCYENDGKAGEPCGTNGGTCTSEAHVKPTSSIPNPFIIPSIVINAIFSDNVTCDNDKTPDSGGRDCDSGLYCCY